MPVDTSSIPDRLRTLPPFSTAALKLLELLANPDVGMSSVAGCIATDPVLAAKLLQRANAADIARYCDVRDLVQATVLLGVDRTRDVALLCAARVFAGSGTRNGALLPCWHHTVACALIASELARLCGLPRIEAYTAGLLHDIGRFGLRNAYPREFDELMAGQSETAQSLIEREREAFGVDHLEVGVWLAGNWNLPQTVAEAIRHHHTLPSGPLDGAALVHVACRMADHLGFSVHQPTEVEDFDEVTALLPPGVREQLRRRTAFLRESIAQEIGLSADAPVLKDSREPSGDPDPEIVVDPQPGKSGSSLAVRVALIAAAIALLVLWAFR